MEVSVGEVVGGLVTLAVALLGYVQWKRTKRSGSFIQDRQAAYKAVWQALEQAHLYIRRGSFESATFDGLVRNANTLLIQHGLHIAEPDKLRARGYLHSLEQFGRLVGQMEATAPVRQEFGLTYEGLAMPPEYMAAYRAYESARADVLNGFRRALGAGAI